MNKIAFWFLLLSVPPNVLAVPVIQNWTTVNGARVFFSPASEIPIVDVRIVFDAGAARDGGNAGLATLTNNLLLEGAGKLDADMIAERLDNIGARMNSGSLRDMAWLSVRALSEEAVLRDTVALMSLILSKPTFPSRSFERLRKSMLVNLRARLQDPSKLAEDAFMKAVYGTHPYASPPAGTEESLNAMQLKQVGKYYRQHYVAGNAVIAIVGDISRPRAEALAKVLTAGLPAGKSAPPLPEVGMAEAKVIHVEYPSTQTHVWAGQPGMTRTDPDYYALYVGNHVLGGSGLISLLSDEIREKRGFAYSVYSYFLPMRKAGTFRMSLQTRNEHALKALNVMRETVRDYLDSGITRQQLSAAKKNITGGFALRLDSNKKLAENLTVIGFYGLPIDYLDSFNAHIEDVMLEDVNDAFRRRVKPASMVTVIVGPDAPPQAGGALTPEK